MRAGLCLLGVPTADFLPELIHAGLLDGSPSVLCEAAAQTQLGAGPSYRLALVQLPRWPPTPWRPLKLPVAGPRVQGPEARRTQGLASRYPLGGTAQGLTLMGQDTLPLCPHPGRKGHRWAFVGTGGMAPDPPPLRLAVLHTAPRRLSGGLHHSVSRLLAPSPWRSPHLTPHPFHTGP